MDLNRYSQFITQDKRATLLTSWLLGLIACIKIVVTLNYMLNPVVPKLNLPKVNTYHAPILAKLHLFGFYTSDYDDLPETQLQLKLEGTAIEPNAQQNSLAIINDPNNQTKTYHIGDIVPGGASIHAIEENRIILNDNGLLERLSMHLPTLIMQPPTVRPPLNSGLSPS